METVLIADDEKNIREGIKCIIDWEELGFKVCGEVANGEEALKQIYELHPSLVLLDIKMPKLTGLEVVGMIGLLFVCLLVIDLFFWRNVGPAFMSVFMTVVSVCVGYLVFIVFLWLFPVIAKLENPLRVQIKNAAAMAVAHFFPYTLFVSVIVLAAGYMAYTSIITDVLLLLMGFALLAYVCSFFFYKVFAKYIDEEPVGEDDPLYGSRE